MKINPMKTVKEKWNKNNQQVIKAMRNYKSNNLIRALNSMKMVQRMNEKSLKMNNKINNRHLNLIELSLLFNINYPINI